MTSFQVSALITAIVSFVISAFTLFNGRSKVNAAWAFTTFLLGLWSLGLLGVISSHRQEAALGWQYLLDASAVLIPVSFFSFVSYLLNLHAKKKKELYIFWGISIALFLLSFTPWFKLGVAARFNFNYWVVVGPAYFLFPALFLTLVPYSMILLLIRRAESTDPVLRMQINFVLAAQIFGFGGGISNFLPQIFNIYPLGSYFTIVYIFFIGYAILKHNLFNLEVIATELLIYLLWIFLAARILLAKDTSDKIVEGILLVIVVAIGILLINAVRRSLQQREQLERLTEELGKANDQLKALDQARAEFISIASHQLRTPPATVKWYLSAVIHGDYGPLDPKVKETLVKTERTNNLLISLIEDILNVSRIERGKMEFLFEQIDLVEMARTTYDQLIPLAREKEQVLQFAEPKTKLPLLMADREKLRQVMNNLIDNAIKYTSRGGSITVSVAKVRGKDEVAFSVKDTGKGLRPDDLNSIFQKYARGKESIRQSAGLGLGLYVARIIIEQHKGRIWAQSAGEGRGSVFAFSLPIKSGVKATTILDLATLK